MRAKIGMLLKLKQSDLSDIYGLTRFSSLKVTVVNEAVGTVTVKDCHGKYANVAIQMLERNRTKLDLELERYWHLETLIGSIWCEASRHGHSHQWILEQETSRVYGHPFWKKLTQGSKEKLNTIGYTWLKAAQQWRIFSASGIHEGIVYSANWNGLPEPLKERVRSGENCGFCAWSPEPNNYVNYPEDKIKRF